MKSLLVFGAYSAIAQAVLRKAASDGLKLIIVGRDEQRLETLRADLKTRGAEEVAVLCADLAKSKERTEVLRKIDELYLPDAVLVAHGVLPDQEACQVSYTKAIGSLEVNLLSVIALLTPLANAFEDRGSGTLGVITSVAADRGRKSNYVYGTAKAALSTFLSGLRNRLHSSGVHVVEIRPGFVDTPMTADIEKGPLFASPEAVGGTIYASLRSGAEIVYAPWFWRIIMTVIRLIPEFIFKRLSL